MKADEIVEKLVETLTSETEQRVRAECRRDALETEVTRLNAELRSVRNELSTLKLARAA